MINWYKTAKQTLHCVDCGISTISTVENGVDEYYVLKNDVWAASGLDPHGGELCIGCLEKRLGRKLNRNDFENCLLNYHGKHIKPRQSDRLLDRLYRQV